MDAASVYSSQADVWYLKEIAFGERRSVKIITQNFNGPCSFIAICNILILRNQIEILPRDRTTVSYEFLSQLVGEYLLTNCPDIDISAALSILPSTTKGLDLNPQFTHISAFSPASGELALFAQAGIHLVHGWLVDPDSPEAAVMTHVGDYDTAVTLIADADYLTKGRLLGEGDKRSDGGERERYGAEAEAGPSGGARTSAVGSSTGTGAGTSNLPIRRDTSHYSDQDQLKIEHAIVAQQFLDATKSQLTYHGLFQLASMLEPGSLVALYRNAHLSVVYKSRGSPSADNADPAASTSPNVTTMPSHAHDSALYALVTDDVFLHEPAIVWERLEDVDGYSSSFVDSDFHRAVPVGGDVAGAWREVNAGSGLGMVDPADQALARQMQAEEDARARELYQRRHQALDRRHARDSQGEAERQGRRRERERKNKNCVVM